MKLATQGEAMNADVKQSTTETAPVPDTYEAPRVEVVLDADSLQREVHYAGVTSRPPA